MPELIEVELYRQALDAAIGRRIVEADVLDPTYPRHQVAPEAISAALVGASVVATERHGKVAVAVLDSDHRLGLRFGMTGRLVVDDHAVIDELEYSSGRDEPAWDRVVVRFADGGVLRINDPRRFGSVELDPDLTRLGPDATLITGTQLAAALRSDRAVKAVLLDQSRVAGLGNLLVDETLWRAGIDPARSARSLDHEAVAELRRVIRRTVSVLTRRGGSHRGDLQDERHEGGTCPADGERLLRRTIGGRTTMSCPLHQI